jgi:ABC-type lipoprotein export system ATPase subunit
MSDVLVRASGLSRLFGNAPDAVVAIAEATFEVRAADKVALVGPSGSGKSSLLHIIAGIDLPTGGTIEWPALGGREDLRPGPVALAFQGPSLLPPLSVEENVALPLLLAGRPAAAASAAALAMIGKLGLSDIAAKLPEEISGGQAQRAGVARALVGEPSMILADEPTGQLDRGSARALMDVLLEHAQSTGAALIVATHDAAMAARLPLRWSMNDRRLETGEAQRLP